MNQPVIKEKYDAIVVGSGPAGATIARELGRAGLQVLVIEAGSNLPTRESVLGFGFIARPQSFSRKLTGVAVKSTGGCTAMYFAVAEYPPVDLFNAVGIDLTSVIDDIKREIPITELPDEMLGEQAIRVRDSARSLGYRWRKNLMLVDQKVCSVDSHHNAKWKSTLFLDDAVRSGVHFLNNCKLVQIMKQNGKAVGVEFKWAKKMYLIEKRRVFAEKIIIAAGAYTSSKILLDAGITSLSNKGFQTNPSFTLFGKIPNLKATDNFPGCMSDDLADGISLGDANVSPVFYRMMMFDNNCVHRVFSYEKSIAIAVKINDQTGGSIDRNGKLKKELIEPDLIKLKKAEFMAREIAEKAGAKSIFKTKVFSANVAGVLRFKEDIDTDFQTSIKNLYVCDGSLIPENFRGPPTLSLVAMGKKFSQQLISEI